MHLSNGKIKSFFIIISLFVALTIVTLVWYMFSTCLDFFPWGSKDSYVIWESLIVYYFIPCFLLLGIIRLVLLQGHYILYKLSFFIASVLLYVPSYLGFDLETDLLASWLGVICSTVLIFMFIVELRFWILTD